MDSKDIFDAEKEIKIGSQYKFLNLKSEYFLQKIFDFIPKKISLEIIKCNKKLQQKLNININSYKDYSEIYSAIELEIVPIPSNYCKFINIKEDEKKYIHIYFNDSKEKINREYANKEDNVSKINIVIDYQIKSFNKLFYYCERIESIKFNKFYRNNIIDMSSMFVGCSSLKEINFSNFNTNNVTNMSGMFEKCKSLKELNLFNFNTNNVTNMSYMFEQCYSLIELNLSKFNTNNVTNMEFMFDLCASLEKININNFNTKNVINMDHMFNCCSSLKELNITNFNIENVTNIDYMFCFCSSLKQLDLSNFKINNEISKSKIFWHCSDELKQKIKNEYPYFDEDCF